MCLAGWLASGVLNEIKSIVSMRFQKLLTDGELLLPFWLSAHFSLTCATIT